MSVECLFVLVAVLDCVLLLLPTFAVEIAIHSAEDFLVALNLPGPRLLHVYTHLNLEGPVIVNTEATDQEGLLSILVRTREISRLSHRSCALPASSTFGLLFVSLSAAVPLSPVCALREIAQGVLLSAHLVKRL